ncbi:MAG: YihY/virulence factor BrkB family protein [Nitrospirota bacterium]|nr:MAG: YihY/virulence factor BrkB family protein [Nitrospirota bacterium]
MGKGKRVYFCWAIVKETVRKFFADNGLFLASGLSFDLLLYCMPLSLLLVSGLGYTLVGSDQAVAWVHETLQNFLPGSQQPFFDALDRIITNRGPLGLVGFLAFFILTSALFGSVRIILNTVFHAPPPKSFLRGKFKDFLVMLGVSLLLLLTISVELLGTIINALSQQIPSLGGVLHQGMTLVTDLLSFFFTVALFFLLYRFSPSRSLGVPALLVGSLTGATLFALSKIAFSAYVTLAQSITVLYGALGGFIFFFLWLFYSSTVFVIGAEVCWAFQHIRQTSR